MEVWSNGFAENGQGRVAIRTIVKVAQQLIERAVLLNDIDYVLDLAVQEFHYLVFARRLVGIEVVDGDLACQRL